MAGGKSGGQTLQFAAHGVKFGQLVVVQRCHDQAAPVARQHRLGFQPLQRLSHGGSRYAQAISQFAFDQPVAGFVDPGVDGFEDQRIGVFLHGMALQTQGARP